MAEKPLTRWPGWEREEGLSGIQDGPCDRVRRSLRLPLRLGLPVCPGCQRATLLESWGCQHRVSPLPTPGPTVARGSRSVEAQADFPGVDSQAGAQDKLFVNQHFAEREEQVWRPPWVQSVGQ